MLNLPCQMIDNAYAKIENLRSMPSHVLNTWNLI